MSILNAKMRRVYKIIFNQQGQIYELFAKIVDASPMYGFLKIEDIIFGERSQLVVDPSEERLKAEFSHVEVIHVPFHCVLRVDEVEKAGVNKIRDGKGGESNVAAFPMPIRPES